MSNVIETRNLSRRFGKKGAVHDLTIAVPEGRIFAFLGPNGAGKSTTIKLLMNILEPAAGDAGRAVFRERRDQPREKVRFGVTQPVGLSMRMLHAWYRQAPSQETRCNRLAEGTRGI